MQQTKFSPELGGHERKDGAMPRVGGNLYRPLVHALFDDTQTMVLGVLFSSLGCLLTAHHTGATSLYACSLIMLLVGVGRWMVNISYRKRLAEKALASGEMHNWELFYSIGAIATVSCLAAWCIITLGVLQDNFASIASIALTFANLIGVCGRNFPIARLINWQITIVGSGLVIGSILRGDSYTALAVMMIPFVFSIRKITSSQRTTLFSALTERRKAQKLATQFHTTLDNVPQAICMFDAGGRLEVANTMLLSGLGVESEHVLRMSVEDLVEVMIRKLKVGKRDAVAVARAISNNTNARTSLRFTTGGANERTIKLVVNPMANGGVVATFEDITREIEAKSTIDHISRFDKLTDLPNREEFTKVLTREMRLRGGEHQSVVMLVNLDRFKLINDTLSHRFGDLVLLEVTKRLKSLVGDGGCISRYGGDEFAISLRGRDCTDFASALADQIIDDLNHPLTIEGHEIALGCSIGMAVGARVSDTAEMLLKQADMALFSAKSEERGNWRFFDKVMGQELEHRRKLEDDLRNAIKNGEFETHFQPLVSVKERQITTCEALVRWKHPENGYVSPGMFIPMAEELGLIEEIGAWVMHDACRTCATWPMDTRVAVNLSAVQFKQGDIFATVEKALSETGLDPSRLELEITESLMLSDTQETIAQLNRFKEMGLRVSLDDFGTGYSSLSYMNDLPLDKVKIDRSFINDLEVDSKALTLVQGISALGRELGLSVVVEGIESQEQLGILLNHASVSEIQGFYFSRPLPEAEIGKLLDRKTVANRSMLARMRKASAVAA